MTMSDNRTTELLMREFVDDACECEVRDYLISEYAERIEQAMAATLGRPKAKSHPYGYERDTGAYDCTRCECGCINDISATYCNDCGGEIEIDVYAEKEIYRIPRHLVFAEKHDDGSLEFCERRYVPEDAATLGGGECEWTLKEKWPNRMGDDHVYGYEASCGVRHTWWPDSLPNFCPTCGGRVKAVKR